MILYFSGTGNSRYVAERLGELLGERVVQLTPSMRGSRLMLDCTEQRVLWVYPIYSWGVPPYVHEIVRSIHIASLEPVPHHAVVTCGDDCGRVDMMWREALKRRGWLVGSIWSVQMPNNYVALKGFDVDSPAVEAAKLAAAHARIEAVARDIVASELEGRYVADIVRGRFAWFKTALIYPWFVSNAMNPSRFHSTDGCVGCGECARVCPLGNIEMKNCRPRWGNDCAGCLACYHICPCHAVAYGKATDGKGQYFLKGV